MSEMTEESVSYKYWNALQYIGIHHWRSKMKKSLARIIALKTNPESQPKERTKFCRELYGYTDFSQYGKYKYQRQGILSDVPYISPVKSVLIVRNTDAPQVISFLNDWNIEIYVREIVLEETDKEHLGRV